MANMRGRGERAGLSQTYILEMALRLADSEGLEGLSMRKLAERLGVAPNALYTYVADKDALLAAMLERVLEGITIPGDKQSTWDARLRMLMLSTRSTVLSHPTLAPAFLSRPGGPVAVALGEKMLAWLDEGGIRGNDGVRAVRALLAYTLGHVALEAARLNEPDRTARQARAHARNTRLPAANFPHTRRHAAHLAQHPGEVDFLCGLSALLRGLAN